MSLGLTKKRKLETYLQTIDEDGQIKHYISILMRLIQPLKKRIEGKGIQDSDYFTSVLSNLESIIKAHNIPFTAKVLQTWAASPDFDHSLFSVFHVAVALEEEQLIWEMFRLSLPYNQPDKFNRTPFQYLLRNLNRSLDSNRSGHGYGNIGLNIGLIGAFLAEISDYHGPAAVTLVVKPIGGDIWFPPLVIAALFGYNHCAVSLLKGYKHTKRQIYQAFEIGMAKINDPNCVNINKRIIFITEFLGQISNTYSPTFIADMLQDLYTSRLIITRFTPLDAAALCGNSQAITILMRKMVFSNESVAKALLASFYKLNEGCECQKYLQVCLTIIHGEIMNKSSGSQGAIRLFDYLYTAAEKNPYLGKKMNTPLHLVVAYGEPRLIEHFFEQGKYIHDKNSDGLSPLMLLDRKLRRELAIPDDPLNATKPAPVLFKGIKEKAPQMTPQSCSSEHNKRAAPLKPTLKLHL